MPKVKLAILTTANYSDSFDDYSIGVIRQGIIDWEDISDEDYDFLCRNRGYLLNKVLKIPDNSSVLIIKQDEESIPLRISSIRELFDKMEKDRIEEEKARIAKKEAASRKRKLKKEAKTKEEELALLDTLKAKYENNDAR